MRTYGEARWEREWRWDRERGMYEKYFQRWVRVRLRGRN